MTDTEKWKARARSLASKFAGILDDEDDAWLKIQSMIAAALAEAYEAGREEVHERGWVTTDD